METWLRILILVVPIQLFISIAFLAKDMGAIACFPKEIRDTCDITWFGAIFVFMLLLILIPFLYLFGLIKLMFTGRWFEK